LVSLVVGHATGSDDGELDGHGRMFKRSQTRVKPKKPCDCRVVRQGDAAKSSAGVPSRSLGSSTGSNVPPAVGVSREDAEARRVGDRVPQLPKTFCGHEGVLECSGLTKLGMGIERVEGKIQSGVKPPQSKKEGSGISREGANGLG
jgi:hypothetical protein